MNIDVGGYALRLLEDFIHYATLYPGRMAESMWYCEDTFSQDVSSLQKAYADAVAGEGPLEFLRCCGR